MTNSSQVVFFTLAAYFDTGPLKYLLFSVLMCLYAVTVCSNLLLIVVIWMNSRLHEPMYMFLCSLFFNEVLGSSALFPPLLLQILADVHTVPASFCFLQIFFLFAYGGVEFLNLAVMSYDRYLAICHPLHYSSRMTANRTALLIAMTWLCPVLLCTVMTSLSKSLRLCGSIIEKVYCDNYSIVRLACSDTTVNNVYGLLISSLSIFGPLILIVYTYLKILRICFRGCQQTRQKAVSTCTPHLASLLNFTCGASFEIVQSRFNMKDVPNVFRIFLSLYWLTCQPVFSPLLYGLNLSKVRIICRNLISAEL